LGIYCDPVLGIIQTPTECPAACSGVCDPDLGCRSCPGADFTYPAQVATGVGAGVIAGIVIAAVAGVIIASIVSKKGYDIYMKGRAQFTGANENPLYSSEGRTGVNPLHENVRA